MNFNQDLASQLPPHDLQAEQSLLGNILLNSRILDDVADKVKPEYFYNPENKIIYTACMELWLKNRPVDILSLLNILKKAEYTAKINQDNPINEDVLVGLIAKSSLISSPVYTAENIRDKFLLRSIINTSDSLKTLALGSQSDPKEVLDSAQQKLYEISLDTLDKNFVAISDILGETFERISNLYNSKDEHRGIPTGFSDIDKILGGLNNSDLIILAARPSMGKTALSLEIVKRIAMKQKIGVAVFSLEMSKDQLVDRMLSSVSGIDAWKIKTGKFSPENENQEFAKLGAAIGQLDQAPVWIDDSGSLNILELRSKARRLKSRHNIGLIVVDYLQLMSNNSGRYQGNRVQEVSDISRGLKMLAKELDIPVLALSQLSRNLEGREDKRPMLSDLRESGSIEQDADVVMFVHRESMFIRDIEKKKEKEGQAEVLIAKHRNGRTGTVQLAWLQRLATFENLEGAKVSSRIHE